jgi:hypothetical protein
MNCMKYLLIGILIALSCVAVVSAQKSSSLKPKRAFRQAGIAFASPNEAGWSLLRSDKLSVEFQKRVEGETFEASVQTIKVKTFETDKEMLQGFEEMKVNDFSKLNKDHAHYNYLKFKKAACVHYDAFFPHESAPAPITGYFNVRGYLCSLSRTDGTAVQIQFSKDSNARGFTEGQVTLMDDFFESVAFSKP